ncbi:MAG: PH domain-containing protein [Anaerolineae bacterium]|nr:PH domain-containing protein [Anaerolineae bacterium]
MRSHFTAPWSRKLLATTAILGLILVIAAVAADGWGALVVIAIGLVAATFAIRGYSIVEGELLIHRLGWSTRYDLADLSSIRFEPGATMGSIRALGIGGLFGFVGHYHNEMLGTYKAYATDEARTVVIEFSGQTIVVTPGDPVAFVEAVEATQG